MKTDTSRLASEQELATIIWCASAPGHHHMECTRLLTATETLAQLIISSSSVVKVARSELNGETLAHLSKAGQR
jgi:hypothetical protein